jgi:hypothetical protein
MRAVEKNKKNKVDKKASPLKPKGGAGIVDEEVRRENEIVHKGRAGEIDDEEENTDQKGFDRSVE